MSGTAPLQVLLIGGGMIAHDQILPSLYQLQRLGVIGPIGVVGQHGRTIKALAEAPAIRRAFPNQSFTAYPALAGDLNQTHPDLYKQVIQQMPPHNLVVVGLPDHLHFESIMTALKADQHVLAVKPLVLTVAEAEQIEQESRKRNLLVAIEYHKRFDDRSSMARKAYRDGRFGEFKLGAAVLMEKWYYRHSNFQNWCTTENSDPFTYIGCHYVDLVHFITGLKPTAVSVYGIKDRYPNGREGFLWADARVLWENGACLNVQTSLSFPDAAPGTNTQGITLYCAGNGNGTLVRHSDQYRGLEYVYTEASGSPGSTTYSEPSPDYFQYVDRGRDGIVPVGYGYRSIEAIVQACLDVRSAPEADRGAVLDSIDNNSLLATPANSRYNEAVIEAGRQSILNGGVLVEIAKGQKS